MVSRFSELAWVQLSGKQSVVEQEDCFGSVSDLVEAECRVW